ncbi:17-beta-hydroxysteroid dehydrogenase type 1 isoform X2 [Arvicanthis niloticus]|uniref:17-beta-hydroxysteroid dehydrogenase type 1 isoform X2 n=1 Tax=Arvicanthis niloticus TaxID=61156 RepID=UPI00402BCF4A
MDPTVVLITGCSSGIGLHLAVRLASDRSQGFKGIGREERSGGQGRVPRVCNAGRGLFGPLEAHELNAVGAVLDVNVLGTIRMLQAFLPDMKRRHSGRVLVTASVGGLMGLPFHEVYCASKFALEGLCESLAILLPLFGVHVSLIECGAVHTAFYEKLEGGLGGALERVDAQTRQLFAHYLRSYQQAVSEAQDPEEVTEVFLTAIRAQQPALRYFSTNRFLPLARMRTEDPSGRSYVAAMHHKAFSDLQAQEDAKAGAQVPGDPDTASSAPICLPECAAPRVASELGWSASDKPGQDKSCYRQ